MKKNHGIPFTCLYIMKRNITKMCIVMGELHVVFSPLRTACHL